MCIKWYPFFILFFSFTFFLACLSPACRCSLGLASSSGSHRWCEGVLQRTNCCEIFKQMKSISGCLTLITFTFMRHSRLISFGTSLLLLLWTALIEGYVTEASQKCILSLHHEWWCSHHVELTSCSWSLCVFHLEKKRKRYTINSTNQCPDIPRDLMNTS